MEIQKIFSEINTDEKLYSVLMSEDELALFSEIQKEFGWREVLQKVAKTPEAKRMISTSKTAANRIAVKCGQAVKGVTDESLRHLESNSGVYARSMGGLLKRDAEKASNSLKKGAKEVSKGASTVRKDINKMSASDVIRSLYK